MFSSRIELRFVQVIATYHKSPFDFALELSSHGISTIPLLPAGKLPTQAWQRYRYESAEPNRLQQLFPPETPDLNVGILCGAASDRLAVIDCDNQASFERMICLLGDPETWMVKSFRGGHIYLRPPCSVRSRRFEAWEVKAEGNYVLAPGSLHPKGVRYEFIKKTERVLELETLQLTPEVILEPAPAKPQGFPTQAWLLLAGGPTKKNYRSRSEREQAACTSLVAHGFGFDAVLDSFIRYADTNSKFFEIRTKNPDRAIQWLRHGYEKARQFVATNISPERMRISHLLDQTLNTPWPGRTGLADRATYLAHLGVADKVGNLVYGASVRELAEYAGISKNTVSKANRRLIMRGCVKQEKAHTLNLSTVWRIESSSQLQDEASLGHSHHSPTVRECPKLSLEHDAFRRRGGKSVAQVWLVLRASDSPLSCQALADQTGRTPRTIRRALLWMERHGLAEQVAKGWVPFATADLDGIAEKIGTAGKASRQKIRHTLERQRHNRQLLANEAPKHGQRLL